MPSNSHSGKILFRKDKFPLDSLANRARLVKCISHETKWQETRMMKVYDIEVVLVREDEVSLIEIRKTIAYIFFSEIYC